MRNKKPPNGARLKWVMEVAVPYTGDECVIFPFGATSSGYGDCTVAGQKWPTHRYVCTLAHGPAPSAKHDAAHSCGRKLCANKRHLRWATRKENKEDELIHGSRPRGELHPGSKLSIGEVVAIREAVGPQDQIAQQFGIVQQTVSDIKCRRRWAWV